MNSWKIVSCMAILCTMISGCTQQNENTGFTPPPPVWGSVKQAAASVNSQYRERESFFSNFYSYPTELVCLGDSITQKLEWQDALPQYEVKNRGIGSDTTLGVLARLDSIVLLQPQTISLMVGINDLAQNHSMASIEHTYGTLLDNLHELMPEARIIVTSVLPVAKSHTIQPQDIVALNGRIEALCRERGIVYLDLFSDFADENGHLKDEYALDSVHLTAQGYTMWLKHLKKALE